MLKKMPQQERSRAMVASILEAATRILSTQPLRETTTNHIATVAGVGIGSLYQYFASKEAIAQCLLDQHREDSLALADEVLRAAPGSVAERYRTMMRELLAVHERARTLHLNFSELQGQTPPSDQLPDVRQHLELVAQLLRDDHPQMDAISALLHAQVMMRSVHALVHCAIQLQDPQRDHIALEHYDAFVPQYCRFMSAAPSQHSSAAF
jgi:AcrR family transcriptional regulator